MSDNQHLVYVIYYDGAPIDHAFGSRAAYLKEGTARAQIKRLAKNAAYRTHYYRRVTKEEIEAEISRFTVVPYGRVTE
ncbi:hypothetical protein ACFOQM_23430 [Paenibacillus sp. GCM10012307]|uniref:Uncharacterized protein n=1 Tax=Paenibacillus roseus TaxID=2798579 RepID=A0A934JBT4_9BACL|nr:hypothetical protein [Paenibacillus roseus]MBJ6364177.1 hypothetical protein [Paenibacillus roseus]